MISFSQIFCCREDCTEGGSLPNNIHNIINDVQDNVTKDIEDAKVSIRSRAMEIKVGINPQQVKKRSEQKLEDLEGGSKNKGDSSRKHIAPGNMLLYARKIILDRT